MQAGPSDGPRLTGPPTQLGFTPQARASQEKLTVWGSKEDPTTLLITAFFFLFSSFENIFFQFMTYILIFFFFNIFITALETKAGVLPVVSPHPTGEESHPMGGEGQPQRGP